MTDFVFDLQRFAGLNISNSTQDTLIQGTTDDDTIINTAMNVSINAGAGNDYITLDSSATNNFIEYSSGDGNDTIEGFNDSSTLSVSG